jgi:hypothetical protein
MTEYRKRKRYRPRVRTPYRASAADLYLRMLNRYRSIRPTRGGGGGYNRRPNRPILEKYQPATPQYKPKTRETSYHLRRESHSPLESPTHTLEADTELLLTELEKRFDERLQQRGLEMMEKEFDEPQADSINRYNLAESSPDKQLQKETQQLAGSERWQEQTENTSMETREAKVSYSTELPDEKQDEDLENTNDESPSEPASEVVDIETQESIIPPEPEPTELLEPPGSNHTSIEHPQEGTVSPEPATEPIEVNPLDSPLLLADIEALYNELELEELEPEEETIEPA